MNKYLNMIFYHEMSEIDESREYKLTDKQKKHYTTYKDIKNLKFKTAEEERAWARTQKKVCSKCEESLPLSYFHANTSGKDPFNKEGYRLTRPECGKCTNDVGCGEKEAKDIAKKEGKPYKAPEGTKCELCNKTKDIVFDHDHVKNIFRGWLCNPCNRALGVLGDNVEGLIKALNYLKKTR